MERRGVWYTLSVNVVSSRCSMVAVVNVCALRCVSPWSSASSMDAAVVALRRAWARVVRTGERDGADLRERPRPAGSVSACSGLLRRIGGVSICRQGGPP